jgi:dihydroflavonol-4-reductase
MKVLVTGGTGFIGRHLLDHLRSREDVETFALVRDPRRLEGRREGSGLRILRGDLFSIPPLPSGLDVVIHLAGLTKTADVNDYYTVNAEGTASLVRALVGQRQRPRLVHLSSLAAGGPSSPAGPVREDDPPRPVSPYGESKLRAEVEALKGRDALRVSVLRVAAVYGPGDEDFLAYFRYIDKGFLPLLGRRPRYLSLCHVRDVIAAIDLCTGPGTPADGIFNIADPTPYSWEDLGRAAAAVLGKKLVPLRVPMRVFGSAAAVSEFVSRMTGRPSPLNRSKYRDARQHGWVADVRKAKEVLGFETRTALAQGIKETIDWYIARKKLRGPTSFLRTRTGS